MYHYNCWLLYKRTNLQPILSDMSLRFLLPVFSTNWSSQQVNLQMSTVEHFNETLISSQLKMLSLGSCNALFSCWMAQTLHNPSITHNASLSEMSGWKGLRTLKPLIASFFCCAKVHCLAHWLKQLLSIACHSQSDLCSLTVELTQTCLPSKLSYLELAVPLVLQCYNSNLKTLTSKLAS